MRFFFSLRVYCCLRKKKKSGSHFFSFFFRKLFSKFSFSGMFLRIWNFSFFTQNQLNMFKSSKLKKIIKEGSFENKKKGETETSMYYFLKKNNNNNKKTTTFFWVFFVRVTKVPEKSVNVSKGLFESLFSLLVTCCFDWALRTKKQKLGVIQKWNYSNAENKAVQEMCKNVAGLSGTH